MDRLGLPLRQDFATRRTSARARSCNVRKFVYYPVESVRMVARYTYARTSTHAGKNTLVKLESCYSDGM
jgi:hypothetical protein